MISHQSPEQGAKSNSFTSCRSACDSCLLVLEVKREPGSIGCESGSPTEDEV